MKNRIAILLSLGLLIAIMGQAQEFTDQSLYNRNLLVINPAVSGYTDGLNLATGFRKQWLGIDGAPTTLSLSAHGFHDKFNVGVGLNAQQYTLGAFTHTSFFTTYSYRIEFSFATLQLGLQAGLISNRSDLSGENILGVNDPSFVAPGFRETKFNTGTGAFLFSENYYVGVSAPLLINAKYGESFNNSFETNRPVFLTAGYLYRLEPNLLFKPYFYTRYLSNAPFGYDIGLTAYYEEHFGLGLLYKSSNTISLNVEIIYNKSFYISYAYDLSGGNTLNQAEHGSHEIVLNYIIPWNKESQKTVRYY